MMTEKAVGLAVSKNSHVALPFRLGQSYGIGVLKSLAKVSIRC